MKIRLRYLLSTICCLLGMASYSQERIVDDAAITTYRSFQIETWYGEYESVFMPAIGANSWLELGAGLVFDSKNSFQFSGLILEAKVVNSDYEKSGQAWGLVVGNVLDESLSYDEFYAYLPYSRLIFNKTSVVHLNAGLAIHRHNSEEESKEVNYQYGVRGDFGILQRFDLLGGVFAENFDFGFYVGFRYDIIPDLLQLIPTFGQGFQPHHKEPGLSVQITFTPAQLW